ncbi:MAG: outer membrane protein assembly factor BamE [Kangiellaceae bacterium]|nr:outer membrane protein assembly factor BamE [Kangiellaceae bacterium]
MNSASIRLCVVVSIFVLMAGCSSIGNNSLQYETSSSISTKIREGVTNKTDIYTILGTPSTTTFTGDGFEVAKYEYTHLTPRAQNFIPYNVFSRVQDGKKKELVILFDSKSIVKKYVINESDIQVRKGILE